MKLTARYQIQRMGRDKPLLSIPSIEQTQCIHDGRRTAYLDYRDADDDVVVMNVVNRR